MKTAARIDGTSVPGPEWHLLEEKNTKYRAALRRYVQSVNAKDVDAILALYAPDASIEDPYGGVRHNIQGHDAIRAFYEFVVAKTAMELLLVTGSGGNAAAMALRVRVGDDVVDNISVAHFDDQDKITRYTTYWGPGDRRKEG